MLVPRLFIFISLCLSACSMPEKTSLTENSQLHGGNSETPKFQSSLTDERLVQVLDQFCGDCHRTGKHAFIDPDGSTIRTMETLFKKSSKWDYGELAKAAIGVLSWPEGRIPTNSETAKANLRYMPVGRQKYKLDSASEKERPMRLEIINFLKLKITESKR